MFKRNIGIIRQAARWNSTISNSRLAGFSPKNETKFEETIQEIVAKVPESVPRVEPLPNPPTFHYKDGFQSVGPYKKLMYNTVVKLKKKAQQDTVLEYLRKAFIGRNESFFREQILNEELWIYRPNHNMQKKSNRNDFSQYQKITGTELFDTIVKPNDVIVNYACIHELKVPIFNENNIIHEDNDVLVINKPRGIPVHPSGMAYNFNTLEYLINQKYLKELNLTEEEINEKDPDTLKRIRKSKIWVCHRIDKDTSGVLILAKNPETCSRYGKYMESKKGLTKQYLALVHGNFGNKVRIEKHPIIEIDLGKGYQNGVGKAFYAKTIFKCVHYDEKTDCSLVTCFLKAGRKHQVRQHLKNLGFHIVNDPLYGQGKILSKPIYTPPDKQEFLRLRALYQAQLNERVSDWEKESVCTNCGHITYRNEEQMNDNYMRLFSFHYSYEDENKAKRNWAYTAPLPEWVREILPESKIEALMKDHLLPNDPTPKKDRLL